MKIKMKKLVEDGKKIRIKGKGEKMMGGKKGEEMVKIRLKKNQSLRLEGREVNVEIKVRIEDEVMGGKKEVEKIDGRIQVKIKEW